MTNDTVLGQLYPFLGEAKESDSHLDAVLLHSLAEKARDSRDANERFFRKQSAKLVDAARAIAAVYRSGGRLFTMGNGGSSCDAAHFAVEFLHPVTTGRPALAATNLAADPAMLTAVGNDVGIDQLFTRQIIALGRSADGLIGFSTSGDSANLIKAFKQAKGMGLTTIGFAGGDGGAMKQCGAVDHCLLVATDSIHRVQECHVVAYHILWDLVHTLLSERGSDEPRSAR